MSDRREAVVNERLQGGVFQPSRAEIAWEMKCRLMLSDEPPDHAVPRHQHLPN